MKRILTLRHLVSAFCFLLSAFVLSAATPTVTVTLADFTADFSGAGYVVRITPSTGGTAARALTDSDGLASFATVTPGIYALSIEGVGVPTLQIRVPNTADTTAASTIVISAWTPPTSGTTPSGIWENAAGTIKPSANGQNRNTLQFTSGAADGANVALQVDTSDSWADNDAKLLTLSNGGNSVYEFYADGAYLQMTGGTGGFEEIYGQNGAGTAKFDLYADASDAYFELNNGTANSGVFLNPTVATGTAIAYRFNTSNQLTNGDYIVSFQNTNAVRFAVDHAGAVTAASSVTATGDVTGANIISAAGYAAIGSTNRWKTGIVTTEATVALNLTNYVNITINGVTYKLGLVQ